ncbi:hypothetical protein B0H11DRAFT_2250483 [Mycena galericulata]|nr:hypothetical protein B0H11DRAFT_2250483 [Mycena galericulata]
MAAQSRAGVPLPLPVDFNDFVGHMTRPADIPPPSFFELDDINADSLARERKNKASLKLTCAYLEAKNSAAGVTNEDVGEPLVSYYEYSDADKRLMVADKDVVTAVGPLPEYMIIFLGNERMTLPNPHSMSSYDATNIVIPDIYVAQSRALDEIYRLEHSSRLKNSTFILVDFFCDREFIPEGSRMPADRYLLAAFVADATGTCTGNCIRNWLNALHLWHVFNDAPWHGDEGFLPAVKKAADKSGVRQSKPAYLGTIGN